MKEHKERKSIQELEPVLGEKEKLGGNLLENENLNHVNIVRLHLSVCRNVDIELAGLNDRSVIHLFQKKVWQATWLS